MDYLQPEKEFELPFFGRLWLTYVVCEKTTDLITCNYQVTGQSRQQSLAKVALALYLPIVMWKAGL